VATAATLRVGDGALGAVMATRAYRQASRHSSYNRAMSSPGPRQQLSNEEVLHRLQDADVAVFEAVAGYTSPILDRAMPILSEAASYSRIWLGISGLLAAFGGTKGRQTSAEALTAVGVTSVLANLVLKRSIPRTRPESEVPERRRLKQPSSSSFPSGHSASAAAFSSVVADEYPRSYVPITGLAASVAFSRVYTGVHYPGDVLAGWLLGRTVAGVVRFIWPKRWRTTRGAL